MADRGLERDGAELEPVEELLGRYRRFLLCERQLDPATVVGYVHRVRPLLARSVTADGLDLVGLTAADVNSFVFADCRRRTRQSVRRWRRVFRRSRIGGYRGCRSIWNPIRCARCLTAAIGRRRRGCARSRF